MAEECLNDSAVAHDVHLAAQTCQLLGLRGDDDDPRALFGKFADHFVNLLTRTDINTLRRLIKHEYGAAAQQPPCNNDFLLVAAAENSGFRFSGAFERSQVETLE